MKKIINKGSFIKLIGIMLLITALILSNFSAIAYNNNQSDIKNTIIDKLIKNKTEPIRDEPGEVSLLWENFTDGNMPPEGDQGTWEHIITNVDNETWFIESGDPYSEPNCATIHRGNSDELQDEWLITPPLDFSEYQNKEIRLEFRWYTDYYVAAHKDYIDLNVSISTDNGTSWTKLWTEDDVGYFPTWEWINTDNGDPIDLSSYGGESNVKIAFQYYSNSTMEPTIQELSIDDIIVIGEGEIFFACSPGGPYEWWWPMQLEYSPPGVRFHGTVEPFGLGYDWFWDFGDNHTSNDSFFTINFFDDANVTYNVTLTIFDNNYDPPLYASNTTTVELFLIEPPDIGITIRKPSLGIKASINNVCECNATYVNWSITVKWGPGDRFIDVVGNDTIDRIPPKSAVSIQSRLFFFAIGKITIDIVADPENVPGRIKQFTAYKIGPLIFGAQ